MPIDQHWIIERLTMLIPLWLSLSVHECAHAWAAFRLGDDTARLVGRLTLNPIAHIDPIGTLLLPLLGVPFGWARPVPVNPVRFTRRVSMTTGMAIVALAGPVSNVILAVISAVGLGLLSRFYADPVESARGLWLLLRILVFINLALAAFNMLPIPPLDGSRMIEVLLPQRFLRTWQSLGAMGPVSVFLLIILCNSMGFQLFGWAQTLGLKLIVLMMRLFTWGL